MPRECSDIFVLIADRNCYVCQVSINSTKIGPMDSSIYSCATLTGILRFV